MEAEVRYNKDTDKWEFNVLNGGINAGGGYSYNWNYITSVGGVPVTGQFTLGGSVEVIFKAAIERGKEIEELYDQDSVNNYLTTLRIYAYIRAFAGLGFDYSAAALKIGLFGQVSLDVQCAFLNQPYISEEKKGQKLTADGEERFVPGWFSEHDADGVKVSDIRLCAFDNTATLYDKFIESINSVNADTFVNISRKFRFVHNAYSIDDLSVLWTETLSDDNGKGVMQITLYNSSDSVLAESGREVRIGFYSDEDCTVPVTKISGQKAGEGFAADAADLMLIDAGAYTHQFTFDISSFVGDGQEIPEEGIRLYSKA